MTHALLSPTATLLALVVGTSALATQVPAPPASPAPRISPPPAGAPAAPTSGDQLQEMERKIAAEAAMCPIKADPAVKDFGFVPPNTLVRVDATLTNPLDRPVTCSSSQPTCQCTTMDMLGKVIPAGGSITVPVSMKTGGATGEKAAAVRLRFEGVPGLVQVKLRAEVAYAVRGFQMNRGGDGQLRRDPFINAFDYPAQTKGEVTLESQDGKPFRVMSIMGAPPVFADYNPAADAPRASYRVLYDFSQLSCEQLPKYVVIETDRPDARLIDMRMRHQCTRINPAFLFAQYRENLGVMAPGVPHDLAVEIKHANGVRVDTVTSSDPRLDVQLMGTTSDDDSQLVHLRVTPKPDARGVFTASLRFAGVGPDPSRPVPAGMPVATQPRTSDFLVYLKAELPQSAPGGAPAATPAAPPAGAPRASAHDMPDATRQAVLAAPAVARDTRVNAAKITQLGDPSVPSRVVQPLPVVQRIAERADQVPMDAERFAKARAAVNRGLAYLEGSQRPSGAWMEAAPAKGTDQAKASAAASTAVTGLVLKAFAQSGRTAAANKHAQRALEYVIDTTQMRKEFQPDPQRGLSNYVASLVLMGLAAQQDSDLEGHVQTVRSWLAANQWGQAQGIGPRDDWFGGAGYGNSGRPDMSNTQLMLDALHDSGASPDDPAVQRALVFVQRTQNVKENPAVWAQNGKADGGFVYTPANGGESFASDAAGEGRSGEKMPEGAPRSLRSYGSMTYAGFKSMLYAGLAPDDPRVRMAFDWIRHNFTLAENPGLGAQGYYYYVHAMARALLAANQAVISDSAGAAHSWRDELVDALLVRQSADGSWKNTAERWQEAQPDLVTAYAVLALQEALKPVLQSH